MRGSSHQEQTGGGLSASRGCQGWEVQGTNCCPGRSVPGSWIYVGRAAGDDRPGGGANRPQDTPPSCQPINSFIWVAPALYSTSLSKWEARRGCVSEPVLSLWLGGTAAAGLFLLSSVCSPLLGYQNASMPLGRGDESWGGLDGNITLPATA